MKKNDTRKRKVDSGLCSQCGKTRDGASSSMCLSCLVKHRERQRRVECPHCLGDGQFEDQEEAIMGVIVCHVCAGKCTVMTGQALAYARDF